jgi:dihydrofolate synthase / folylpolyglutamate synthase
MESSQQIALRLFSRTTHGIKLGLERMQTAAQRLDNPQNGYKSIHVAGTNGKGSVCAYLESCLRRMGFTTGLFTSPHIVDFEERFIINGTPVSSEKWVGVYRDLEQIINELGLTFFEAATLIAFQLFKRENVEWAIFETGLGGRLDATNILRPKVSVITRIAMDHMDFLGNDLAAIAREKLGIVKRGVPLVMAEPQEPDIRKLALVLCLQNGSQCQFVSESMAQEAAASSSGPAFTWHHQKFELPLAGRYQIQNALVAICAMSSAGFSDLSVISEGVQSAVLPARFQVLKMGEKTIVFDVGHNPDAVKSFVNTLAAVFPDAAVCLVTGIMKDKDAAEMFEQYCKKASRIILTRPDVERSADTGELRSKLPAWFKGNVVEIGRVNDAVDAALASECGVVCVAGSFYTVGEAMEKLGVAPYTR